MNLQALINQGEGKFSELASSHKEVSFQQEALHALQALKGNSFLLSVAQKNPDSLMSAIYEVAMVGLSLNPAKRQAYLVPYGGKNQKVQFIPSYIGLVHLACSTGNIEWVQAYEVREKDTFLFNGAGEKPTHSYDPFGSAESRGALKGAYCVAKTVNGDFLTTMMSINEIYSIRNRSESYSKNAKYSPWTTDEVEMCKKTVVRRAEKMWPKVSERMKKAVEILNNNDGLIEEEKAPEPVRIEELKNLILSIKGDVGPMLVTHVNEKVKKAYDSIEEFNKEEVDYSIEFLTPYAPKGA